MTVRRLGLFGGTFDPPHLGHVAALRAAAGSGRFNRLEVTVAGDPYRKSDEVRPSAQRLAMAHAAFDDLPLVTVSDREIVRAGPSYTVDTVRELLADAREIDLVVGADLAGELDSWHEAPALRDLVSVGIVPRPGTVTVAPEGWTCYVVSMEPVDLSSSFIRAMGSGAANLGNFLPAAVIPIFEAYGG